MSNKQREAHWIGRCPIKGCKTIIRLTVPMMGYDEVRNPHTPQQWTHTRWQPLAGRYYSVHSEGLHCIFHRRQLSWKPIDGKYSEKHVCDSRCMNAVGPNCECSCGGANHGAGHSVERVFTFLKTELQSV